MGAHGPNGGHECLGLVDKFTCIGEIDSVVAVVGHVPEGFGMFEQTPRFFGHRTVLHESVVEGVEHAPVRFADIVPDGQKRGPGGVEHRIVRAVASAVGIAALQERSG